MSSKYFVTGGGSICWLSAIICCISGGNYFASAAAYSQFSLRQQLDRRCYRSFCHYNRRCSPILNCDAGLRSQSDTVCESDSTSEDSSSCCYGQRVAVLLPDSSSLESNDDGNSKWQLNAIQHLRQVATKSKLSVISLDDQSRENNISSYTHLLTAVPCPRTNTYAIAIHANPPQSKKKSREKKHIKLKLDPFFLDLCPSSDTRLGYRMNLTSSNKSGSGSELLLKALGMKKLLSSNKQHQLVIYDMTAGLARDSMIMLSSAISNIGESTAQPLRLHMVERDPLVASLLTDAMRRLDILANLENSNEGNVAKLLTKSLSMEEGDAISVLERMLTDTKSNDSVPYPPDIVYLDPMFPPRKKKASAVKKDMAMLHSLLGTTATSEDKKESEEAERVRLEEEQKLLVAACAGATNRVVVKRPANALPLGFCDEKNDNNSPAPSYAIRGNINRWDVYITS